MLSLGSLDNRKGGARAAGVWSRNGTNAYRVGREIKAGRVWTNCYHSCPKCDLLTS
jgi:acyl-CoA reductase-like NAD-dependent aldehyde dehydrogenase